MSSLPLATNVGAQVVNIGSFKPRAWGGLVVGNSRLPTDPIGTFALTLANVVVGSFIRVEEVSGGALVEQRTAASATEVFSVSAYAGGNPKNDLRIKVRKASAAPLYKPYETQATALVGSQSIFITQQPD